MNFNDKCCCHQQEPACGCCCHRNEPTCAPGFEFVCGCNGCGCYCTADRDPFWPSFSHPSWLSLETLYSGRCRCCDCGCGCDCDELRCCDCCNSCNSCC